MKLINRYLKTYSSSPDQHSALQNEKFSPPAGGSNNRFFRTFEIGYYLVFKNKIVLLLIAVYLFTRLYNLLILPIFTDESIYIYWAKFIAENHSQWFISLGDGKPPLLIWIIAVLLKIFPANLYLLAGRLPSVIFGFFTLFGVYKLSKLLFKNEAVSLITTLLYLISPFTLFYDRMALFDSMLSCMTIWSVYFALKTAETFSIKDAVLWGSFCGLAFLSKGTAIITFALLPVIFLISAGYKKVISHKSLVISNFLVALSIGALLNNSLRISKIYYMMAQKNAQFQQPWHELIENPVRLLMGNSSGIFNWLRDYYTAPLLVFGLWSMVVLLIKNKKNFTILFSLWFIPNFLFAFFGRELFPRYFLFTTPYFLMVCAYGVGELIRVGKRSIIFIIFIIIITIITLSPSLIFDYRILTDPAKAPFPDTDYHQYVSEHPSGYGLDKTITKIKEISQKEKMILVTQGTFGLYPYAFYLQFWNDPNVRIVPKWPIDINKLSFPEINKGEKFYLVIKEYRSLPKDYPLPILAIGDKPGGEYPVILSIVDNK